MKKPAEKPAKKAVNDPRRSGGVLRLAQGVGALTEKDCPVEAEVQIGELFQYGCDPWEYKRDTRVSKILIEWDTETNSIEDWKGWNDGIYYRYPFDQPNEHVMKIVRILK